MTLQERFHGCLIGLACGDAVGTTVEFKPRGTFAPVTDMTGGGPFLLQAGEWTDDTSMALCLATSLLERQGFDPADQMRRYSKWQQEGYLSSNGECFDIGITVSSTLNAFRRTGEPYSGSTDPMSAGNGSIMRLAPVPMYFYPDLTATIEFSAQSSRTTHGAEEAVDACRLFGSIIFKALAGQTKQEILFGEHSHETLGKPLSANIQEIVLGKYFEKTESEIVGNGYVVKSLEAALWCFFHSDNFRDAILRAANLGDDADTTAAICGQIAGAFYGIEGIPISWKAKLAQYDLVLSLAESLFNHTSKLA